MQLTFAFLLVVYLCSCRIVADTSAPESCCSAPPRAAVEPSHASCSSEVSLEEMQDRGQFSDSMTTQSMAFIGGGEFWMGTDKKKFALDGTS